MLDDALACVESASTCGCFFPLLASQIVFGDWSLEPLQIIWQVLTTDAVVRSCNVELCGVVCVCSIVVWCVCGIVVCVV